MKAQSHGDYQIEECQGVIQVTVEGGFNQEGVRALHVEILACVESLDQWGLLFVGHSDSMATPEGLQVAEAFTATLKQLGCAAVAIYNLNLAMVAFTHKVHSESDLPFLVADSVTEGQAFIRTYLNS